jgi:hypothetical protein
MFVSGTIHFSYQLIQDSEISKYILNREERRREYKEGNHHFRTGAAICTAVAVARCNGR